MQPPSHLSTRLIRLGGALKVDAPLLAAKFRALEGVAEAVVVEEERVVYLKVDSRTFDSAGAQALAT